MILKKFSIIVLIVFVEVTNMAWNVEVTNRQPWLKSPEEPKVQENIQMFYDYFYDKMTLEAMAGIMGNILRESAFNPGQIQMAGGTGHGLIQWTPGTIIINYAETKGQDWYSGDLQCLRIWEELQLIEPGYYPAGAYKQITAEKFLELDNVETATRAFYVNRERGSDYVSDMAISLPFAMRIYEIIGGLTPGGGSDIVLLYKHAKIRRERSKGVFL